MNYFLKHNTVNKQGNVQNALMNVEIAIKYLHKDNPNSNGYLVNNKETEIGYLNDNQI